LDDTKEYRENFEKLDLYRHINTYFMLNIIAEILPKLIHEGTAIQYSSKSELVAKYLEVYIQREWAKPGVEKKLEEV